MLYRGMDRAQLDTAYNNSAAVTNYNAIKADWHARSARVRQSRRGHLDLEYGDTPRQHLDPFLADSPRALVGDTRNTFCPPATFHWAFFKSQNRSRFIRAITMKRSVGKRGAIV